MSKVVTSTVGGTSRARWSARGRLKQTYRARLPLAAASSSTRSASCVLPDPAVPTTRSRNGSHSRTYRTISHGCDGVPGAAVPGARSAVRPAQTSVEQRRNAAPGAPSLRVAARWRAHRESAGLRPPPRDARSLALGKRPTHEQPPSRGDPWPSGSCVGSVESSRAAGLRSERRGVGFAVRGVSTVKEGSCDVCSPLTRLRRWPTPWPPSFAYSC